MTTMVYQATAQPEVVTSTVEDMMTTRRGYIKEIKFEALKDKAEGTRHDMIQTGVVLLICGLEEDIMVTVTKMILSERELLVFMEGADDSRSVLLQSRKRTESHNQS
jgi:hypothetical protein